MRCTCFSPTSAGSPSARSSWPRAGKPRPIRRPCGSRAGSPVSTRRRATCCSTSWPQPSSAAISRSSTYRAELPREHPLLAGLEKRYGRVWAEGPVWLENFFGLFPDPALAGRLYQAAATGRVASDIAERLPGLWREAATALADLFAARPAATTLAPREGFFEELLRSTWLGRTAHSGGGAGHSAARAAATRRDESRRLRCSAPPGSTGSRPGFPAALLPCRCRSRGCCVPPRPKRAALPAAPRRASASSRPCGRWLPKDLRGERSGDSARRGSGAPRGGRERGGRGGDGSAGHHGRETATLPETRTSSASARV